MPLFNNIFKKTFLFIFLVELFSFYGYLLPDFNKAAFLIIILLTLILSLIRLEYGIWIVLTELFIGSKGYLFFFEYNGLVISIRIALWLIVMAVWLNKIVNEYIRSHIRGRVASEATQHFNGFAFLKSPYFSYFIILFLFIAWGLINGFLNHNEFNNIFFDFNGWLYFALIFPIYSIFSRKYVKKDIRHPVGHRMPYNTPCDTVLQIFIACILWLSFKTFFLLFVFSHNMIGMVNELYRWVRVSGVGEITQMQGGFYRIFFQSHIFVLIGFFIFSILVAYQMGNKKDLTALKDKLFKGKSFLLLSTICYLLSAVLISFSRSFWVGLIIGLVIYGYIVIRLYSWKTLLRISGILSGVFAISIILIIITVKFPYPRPIGGFTTAKLLSKRISQITGEAGVSSRWSLLPKLWDKIKQGPILGQGFGATVTYQSSDPRILQSSPTGKYTTYAFEWGWLDIWLKLGIFGVLAYLFLIGKICIANLMQKSKIKNKNSDTKCEITQGLIIGLIIISAVNIFSPYLNHPLGIGYLIIISAILSHNT